MGNGHPLHGLDHRTQNKSPATAPNMIEDSLDIIYFEASRLDVL